MQDRTSPIIHFSVVARVVALPVVFAFGFGFPFLTAFVYTCPTALADGPPAGVARPRPPDPVTTWSALASATVAGAGMSPLRQPLTLALVHLAMHDAVAAVTHAFAPHDASALVGGPALRDAAVVEAAIVEAAYTVLVWEVPSGRAALDDARRDALAALAGDRGQRERGAAAGRRTAKLLLARRANDGRDGRNADRPFAPHTGPGRWVPTPPAYLPAAGMFLGRVTPFVLRRASAARPPGPPPLTSRRYAKEFEEVKQLGARASTTRTAAQTANALFWEPLAGTIWPASIRRIAEEQGLDVTRSVRFQAAAFVAFADAMIACWDAKLAYQWWRPITAIAQAARDDNAATQSDAADAAWEPLGVTPNFPEYPSGHACISAAVADVIEGFFEGSFGGSLPAPVAIPVTNIRTGEERRYASAKAIADEVIEARMLLGVHFRSGNEDGARIGHQVAREVRRRLIGNHRVPASR
jgi:hypothetical protein